MFGVVLWSDPKKKSAVIWCEDHGDLAYCDELATNSIDAGDYVTFDLRVENSLRRAQNAQAIRVGAFPDLAAHLVVAAEARKSLTPPYHRDQRSRAAPRHFPHPACAQALSLHG